MLVDDFFADVDRRWTKREDRIPLHIIGSVALLLGTDYRRGTKDSDVVQTRELTDGIKARLLGVAGKGTAIHQRHGMYIEVVSSGFPFLPHVPLRACARRICPRTDRGVSQPVPGQGASSAPFSRASSRQNGHRRSKVTGQWSDMLSKSSGGVGDEAHRSAAQKPCTRTDSTSTSPALATA